MNYGLRVNDSTIIPARIGTTATALVVRFLRIVHRDLEGIAEGIGIRQEGHGPDTSEELIGAAEQRNNRHIRADTCRNRQCPLTRSSHSQPAFLWSWTETFAQKRSLVSGHQRSGLLPRQVPSGQVGYKSRDQFLDRLRCPPSPSTILVSLPEGGHAIRTCWLVQPHLNSTGFSCRVA